MTKLEPRIWKHTILQGDDEEKLRELRAAVARLEPGNEHDAATEAANDFAAEAEGRGVTVTLRSVGRKKWRELVESNPPREGDDDDKAAGINLDLFPEALVPACITGPTFTDGELADFLDALTPAQFDFLALAAWSLHKSLGLDPKGRLGSALAPS